MRIKWYLIIISVCIVLISVLTSISKDVSFITSFLVTCFSTLMVIIIDGITAAICRFLPLKVALKEKEIFKVTKRERNFYISIGIRKWKDKIPEIGHFTGFRKNKVCDPKNPKYINRFINESSYGEIGHFFSMITGFLLLLFPIFTKICFFISLLVAIINGLLNLLPIFVLRYNKFALILIYERINNIK